MTFHIFKIETVGYKRSVLLVADMTHRGTFLVQLQVTEGLLELLVKVGLLGDEYPSCVDPLTDSRCCSKC